jgi:hypothetical protein
MNLDFMASIDLISRVHGLIRTIEFSTIRKRRKHHKRTDQARGAADIHFVAAAGTAPIHAERMLAEYGVPVWDRKLCRTEKQPDGRIIHHVAMKVPASQVTFARYLMTCYGCQVDGKPVAQSPLPPKWSDGQRGAPDDPQPVAARSKRPKTSRTTITKARRALWRIMDEI